MERVKKMTNEEACNNLLYFLKERGWTTPDCPADVASSSSLRAFVCGQVQKADTTRVLTYTILKHATYEDQCRMEYQFTLLHVRPAFHSIAFYDRLQLLRSEGLSAEREKVRHE